MIFMVSDLLTDTCSPPSIRRNRPPRMLIRGMPPPDPISRLLVSSSSAIRSLPISELPLKISTSLMSLSLAAWCYVIVQVQLQLTRLLGIEQAFFDPLNMEPVRSSVPEIGVRRDCTGCDHLLQLADRHCQMLCQLSGCHVSAHFFLTVMTYSESTFRPGGTASGFSSRNSFTTPWLRRFSKNSGISCLSTNLCIDSQ